MEQKKSSSNPAASAAPAAKTATENTNPAPGSGVKTNGLAVAALVLVLIGIIVPGLGLIGVILAIIALVQIGKSKEGGKGLAIAALVIAVVEIVLGIIIFASIMFAVNKAVKDSGVNVNTTTGSVDVQGKDGESLSIGNAKVPDGFPSDVPIYEPSDVILSLKTKEGYNVTLATNDDAAKVLDFYKSKLSQNGWTKTDAEINFGVGSAQSFTKGNSQLVLLIGSDKNSSSDKKTSVSLTVGEKDSSN